MNTAGSVAYGWGILCVAAGVSFYFAKQEIDARRRDQSARGARPMEQLTWQERIAQQEKAAGPSVGGGPRPTTLGTSKPGGGIDVSMRSKPTGVDTSSGASSQ